VLSASPSPAPASSATPVPVNPSAANLITITGAPTAPATHNRGPSFPDWLTAIATLAAVVAALWIAIRDGRQRTKEEQRRALAQARLVRMPPSLQWAIGANLPTDVPGGPDRSGYGFWPEIYNASDRPILNVAVDLWVGDLSARPIASDKTDIVLTGSRATLTAEHVPYQGEQPVAVRVRWEDADGREWFVDFHEHERFEPELYASQAPRPFELTREERRRLLGVEHPFD
jgi:hypothetical protein